MCGGAGSRLWPASRHTRPKQFIPLIGDSSLFQETVSRVTEDSLFTRPICITNDEYRFTVAEQLREIGVDAEIVLEPVRRDSAPALSAACYLSLNQDPNAIVLAMPADHHILDIPGFLDTVRSGLLAANSGYIVTFGAKPDHPSTAYGYIAASTRKASSKEVFEVDRFVEKPNEKFAREYLENGYLWNTGNFLMTAQVFLEQCDEHAPQLNGHMETAVRLAVRDLDFVRLDGDAFANAEANSIDYAVMEKTDRAAVLEARFDWSDVGSWQAVWALTEKDAADNAVHGDGRVLGGKRNYIRSNDALATLVGGNALVVVTTRDTVMVAGRDSVETVKHMVEQLAADGRKEAREHTRVYRPWGNYESIDVGQRYQVKRITVDPQGKLSLQRHYHRSEHWIVVRGTALVTIDQHERIVTENESVYVPLGAEHRLENPGHVPLEMIEVQSGSYLGEDDIVRTEDVYGRTMHKVSTNSTQEPLVALRPIYSRST